MVHQGDGLLPRRAHLGLAGIIGLEQLHQCCCELFGSTAGPLVLQGVPVAVADR